MPYIQARDGTNLHVKECNGGGRPVLLLHGWPLSADSWDDQALALAEAGHRVVAYDRRGFGRSDQPWTGYDYDTLADDLADVLAAVKAVDAAIVGFSMGGGEVARYMSRHGGMGVRQAALVASIVPYMLQTPDNPHGVPQAQFDAMTEQMKTDRAAFFTTFFRQFYGSGLVFSAVSDEVIAWSRNTAMMAGLRPTLACAKAFSTTDFRPELPAFRVPTLIIHGTSDATVPIDASARVAARGIPQAELREYEGAPHGLNATHKHELSRDLLAFLGR
jgi:pimeloyl-ACP methyl ester carboxylesterase